MWSEWTKRKWSGQRYLNPRPSAPKADALPDCAMPRTAAKKSYSRFHYHCSTKFHAAVLGVRDLGATPGGLPTGLVLENDACGRELRSDAIRFSPVLRTARRGARGDARLHLRVADRRAHLPGLAAQFGPPGARCQHRRPRQPEPL